MRYFTFHFSSNWSLTIFRHFLDSSSVLLQHWTKFSLRMQQGNPTVLTAPLQELTYCRLYHRDNVSFVLILNSYCQKESVVSVTVVILFQISDHFVSRLSVRMTSGPDFVQTNFTFFDCNTYSSCTQCVSSKFPCDWCVDGHRCTHDTAENCRNDILVTGVSVSSIRDT